MSKLQTIRQALETNPEVTIIDWEDVLNLDGSYRESYREGGRVGIKSGKRMVDESYNSDTDYRFHIVKYYISPKDGLFTAEELDEFMMRLIPERLKPNNYLTSRQVKGEVGNPFFGGLRFGRLNFIEKLGERRKFQSDTITDEGLLNAMGDSSGFVNGQRIVDIGGTIDLERVIAIKLFPSEAVGSDILHVHGGRKYKDSLGSYGISWNILKIYAPQS